MRLRATLATTAKVRSGERTASQSSLRAVA